MNTTFLSLETVTELIKKRIRECDNSDGNKELYKLLEDVSSIDTNSCK